MSNGPLGDAASDGLDDLLSTPQAGPAAVRGGGARLAGFFAGALASAASAALLFRHLGVTDTGRYVTILSLTAIVGGFSDLGLTAVGVREASVRGAGERAELLRELLGLRLTLTVLGVAVLALLAGVGYSGAIVAGIVIAGVGLLLQVTQDNYTVLLQVELRLGWMAVLDVLRQVGTLAFVGALVLAGAHLLAFVAVAIAIGLVCLAFAVALVRGRRSLLPAFHLSRWRPMIAEVLPYSVAVAASALYFRVAIVMTSAFSSSHQLGLFSASFRIIEFLTIVPALLAGAALPIFSRAARDDEDRLGYALGRVFEVALLVGAWLAVSLAVGAPLAISLLAGHQFAAAAGPLQLLGIALAGTFVSVVWSNALLSLRRHGDLLRITLGVLCMGVLLTGALAALDGATGAAAGLAASEVTVAVVNALVVVRRRPALRPSLRVLPRAALAVAVSLSPMLLDIPVIAQLAISTPLYLLVLVLTRALPPELGALLPALARGRRGAAR
ncbi:MAG TPA: oligosaccharide flippase family protein [Solirubrobacteraceae bacterium]|nr:oligosaccharide flippase family protein [Solirubrobacteraceae bacterium]